MRIIYLSHRIEGDELYHNQLRVLAICRKLMAPDITFYSPILALGGHVYLRTDDDWGWWFDQIKAYFDKRVIDEVWVVSDQTPSVMRELRIAKSVGTPVQDIYSSSEVLQFKQEQVFNLNSQVRKFAHLGLQSVLAKELEKEAGCTSCGHDHSKAPNDKSGQKEMIDESLNVAVSALQQTIKSLGDKAFPASAFAPCEAGSCQCKSHVTGS